MQNNEFDNINESLNAEVIESTTKPEEKKEPWYSKIKFGSEEFRGHTRLFIIAFCVTVLLGLVLVISFSMGGSTFGSAERFYERGIMETDLQKAEEYFIKSIEKDPLFVDARLALCSVYEQQQRYEDVYNCAMEGIEQSPATYEYYGYVVRALCYQGKMAQARQFIDGCTNNYVLLKIENSRPDNITFSTQPGTYGEKFNLGLSTSADATIYYTTDGTEPNLNSSVYNGHIAVDEKLSIRAFAISPDGILTEEVTGDFRVRDENAVYTFVDEAVESVVRSELGNYGDITYKELDELTEFSSENSTGKIKSLADFAEFLNLEKIELYGDTITDFKPLSKMRSLRTLTINRISLTEENLKEIAACSTVITLDLSDCSLTSVSALAPMSSLTTLVLDDNELGGENGNAQSLGALKDIKITKLVIKNNGVTSGGGIGEIISLRNLDISDNSLTSLDDIGKLTKLDSLNASKNAIESVSGLSFLTSLKTLDLSSNALTDITDLASARSVSALNLSDNAIEDFAPLRSTIVSSLTANECGISDLSGVCEILTLRSLDVSDNGISDLSPIRNLPYISELKVANNNINTIKPLKGINTLTSLDIAGNDVNKNEANQFNTLKINWD